MGHNITGVIGRREVLKSLDGKLSGQPCFELAEGFAFMPLDDKNLDDVAGLGNERAIGKFVHLTERLIELLRSASRNGDLAYIETDYHGGVGGQGSAVFRSGELLSTPNWHKTSAINDALQKMGVARSRGKRDVFETVGLDEYRSNEMIREKGTSI